MTNPPGPRGSTYDPRVVRTTSTGALITILWFQKNGMKVLPHKMLIVIAILDELINTQLLASRGESTHSDSAYPFVGLSILTEGFIEKYSHGLGKIISKKC